MTERKLTAQVGTAEAAVAQLAAPPVTHIVVTPPDPLVGTEEVDIVEEGPPPDPPDPLVGPEDPDEVQGDELPKAPLDPLPDPPVVCDEADEDGPLPAEVVMAPVEQGVVGWAVTHAQRELAAPKTAPTDAPQLLITQF
jgi:hypothetical protein